MGKTLFFIPARGGSKGLPGKNIKKLAGKPLMAWTIEAAKECGVPGRIVVSTDSEEIAEVALRYGAEVPWMRPSQLAQDATATIEVLKHFLEVESKKGYEPDSVVILQPTSPLRKAEDIRKSFSYLEDEQVKSVISVCETNHHPYWSNTLPPDGDMTDFIKKEYRGKRRQDLPVYYRINGAIYIIRVPEFMKDNSILYGNQGKAYIMNRDSSVDIDTEIDFLLADLQLRRIDL